MAKREVRVNLKKALIPVAVLVVIVLLALVLLARQNLSEILRTLQNANGLFVALAIGVYVFGISLWATRWKIAISATGHSVGIRSLFLAIWGSVFVNNLTPFTYSGGDPFARTYFLKKVTGTPYSSGFAAITGEFLLDLPVFLSLLMVGLLLSFRWISTSIALLLLGIWFVVVAVVLPLSPRMLNRRVAAGKISGFAFRIAKLFRAKATKAKMSRDVEHFYEGACHILQGKKRVLSMVLIALMLWILIMARFFLIFQALGCFPSVSLLLLAATIPSIVGLIPVLPGGLGTVDMAYLFIFTLEFDPTVAFSAIVIERAITYVFGTLAGAGALSYLGIRIWVKK